VATFLPKGKAQGALDSRRGGEKKSSPSTSRAEIPSHAQGGDHKDGAKEKRKGGGGSKNTARKNQGNGIAMVAGVNGRSGETATSSLEGGFTEQGPPERHLTTLGGKGLTPRAREW